MLYHPLVLRLLLLGSAPARVIGGLCQLGFRGVLFKASPLMSVRGAARLTLLKPGEPRASYLIGTSKIEPAYIQYNLLLFCWRERLLKLFISKKVAGRCNPANECFVLMVCCHWALGSVVVCRGRLSVKVNAYPWLKGNPPARQLMNCNYIWEIQSALPLSLIP